MSTIPLADIRVIPDLQVRDALDEATIQRYMECFDKLPPVVVFAVGDGYVLADGFHRREAARRLGELDMEVMVKAGTMDDCADYAAMANATAGKPLTAAERRRAIVGLHERHPDWSLRQLGDVMSVAFRTVKYIVDAAEVQEHMEDADVQFCTPLVAATQLAEIHAAPQEQWLPLAQLAQKQDWTVQETREAVRLVQSDPQRQLLRDDSGRDPIAVPTREEDAERELAEFWKRDSAIHRGLLHLNTMMQLDAHAAANELGGVTAIHAFMRNDLETAEAALVWLRAYAEALRDRLGLSERGLRSVQ